jgi:hypothetical protein
MLAKGMEVLSRALAVNVLVKVGFVVAKQLM